MKQRTLLFFLLMPFIAISQSSIKLSEITQKADGNATELNTNKTTVNLKDAASVRKAIVEITETDAAEAAKIKLVNKKTGADVPDLARTHSGTTLKYNLAEVIIASDGSFEVVYSGQRKGIIKFELENKETGDNGGDNGNGGEEGEVVDYVGVMGSANFVGNNKFLSNVTPMVTLGKIAPILSKGIFTYTIDVNPYLGSQIDTKDSFTFIPALMLPGRGGIIFNNYFTFTGKDMHITFMPLGIGVKVIPDLKDSATVVWQHNLRMGLAFGFNEIFLVGAQYTFGFHNTTSESKRFFRENINNVTSAIRYLTISGQFYIKNSNDKKNYIFLEWRGLANKHKYPGYDNTALFTLGYHSNLSLTHIFATGKGAEAANKRDGKKKKQFNSTIF
jgi:hypothetical protein